MIQQLKQFLYFIYKSIVKCYYFIKNYFIKPKYNKKSLVSHNSLHLELFNIIPNEDIRARNLINFIIMNKNILQLVCNNPNCAKKLVDCMYCVFDSYYCSLECQKNTYLLINKYWEKCVKNCNIYK